MAPKKELRRRQAKDLNRVVLPGVVLVDSFEPANIIVRVCNDMHLQLSTRRILCKQSKPSASTAGAAWTSKAWAQSARAQGILEMNHALNVDRFQTDATLKLHGGLRAQFWLAIAPQMPILL